MLNNDIKLVHALITFFWDFISAIFSLNISFSNIGRAFSLAWAMSSSVLGSVLVCRTECCVLLKSREGRQRKAGAQVREWAECRSFRREKVKAK